jgi:DNA-nicking Smr family endonuclease
MKDENKDPEWQEPFELPIEGVLDLHTFNPRDVKELLPDYLYACREKGIHAVRIIHGKGTGTLRKTVHSVLRNLPERSALWTTISSERPQHAPRQ